MALAEMKVTFYFVLLIIAFLSNEFRTTHTSTTTHQTTQEETSFLFQLSSGSQTSMTQPAGGTAAVESIVSISTTETVEDVSTTVPTSGFSRIPSKFTSGGTSEQSLSTAHAPMSTNAASTVDTTETDGITTGGRSTSQATTTGQYATSQEDKTMPAVETIEPASTTKFPSAETLYSESATTVKEVSTTQSVATIHRQTTQDKSQSPFHSTSHLEDSTTTPTITTTPVESTVGVTTIDTREDVSTRVTTSGSSTTQTTQSTFTQGGTPSQSLQTMYATPSTYTAATGDATETSRLTTADDRSTSQATTTGQYVTTKEHNTTPTVAIDSTLQASRTKISSTEISTAQGVTTSQQTTHDETTSSFHSTTDLQEPSTKQLVTTTPFESTVDVTTTDIGKDASTTPGFSSSPSQFTSRDVPMQSLSTTDATTVTTAAATSLDSTISSDLATTGGKTTSYQTSTGPYVSTDDLKTSTPAVDTTQSVTSTNIPTTEDPYLWHTTKVPPRLYYIRVEPSSPGTAELSIDIDNYDWYHEGNITYEVSYWSKSDANDSVTVTTYSRYITLTNFIANETYSILVVMTYGALTDTIEMNYTDPCNIHQCLNNALCFGYVKQYNYDWTSEYWRCDCIDAFVGQYCETELFIVVTLVDVTTTTITVNWTLTDNSYWNRFRDYLAIDLIDSEMAESRSYEQYTRLGTTLNRLRPGTSYTVTVTAIERHWHDNFFNTSGSVIVNLPPESPVYADVVYRNASSVYVYWNPGWTDYDTFKVTFVCENGLFESTENVTYPNITLFDLPSNSTCFIGIETISNGVRSETSYQLQINTPQDYCASSPCGINSTHCRSHIDGFACICPSLVNEDEELTTSSNDPSITTYYNTPAYTLDLRLDVVEYGSRAINVTWNITEHSWYRWLQYNFEVTYESCAVGSLQCRECYSMEIDGLLPGTLYVVHVTATDTYYSRTTTSNLIHVRTVPEPPLNVTIWYLSSTRFEATLEFSDGMNYRDIEITYWPVDEWNNRKTVKTNIIDDIYSNETYTISVVIVSGDLSSDPYLLYTTDHCVDSPCHPEASCSSTHVAFVCQCPQGLIGDRCQYDVNECLEFDICGANAVCNNTEGSYSCGCMDGFESNGANETCYDIDECYRNFHTCYSQGSYCHDTHGSYECRCHTGYRMAKNGTCEDINECEEDNSCDVNAQCINYNGRYSCMCNDGYSGHGRGSDCHVIVGNLTATSYKRGSVNVVWDFTESFDAYEYHEIYGHKLALSFEAFPDINETIILPFENKGAHTREIMLPGRTYLISLTVINDYAHKTMNTILSFNFTDLCVGRPCNFTQLCTSNAITERDITGSEVFQQRFVCDCPDGRVGPVCNLELRISAEVVDTTTSSVTIKWNLTDESYWSHFDQYLIVDISNGKSERQRMYVPHTYAAKSLLGLKAGGEYSITVTAVGNMYAYNTSDHLAVSLDPEPPISASAIYDGGSSAMVYWDPGFTEYDAFRVRQTCELSHSQTVRNATMMVNLPPNSTCWVDIETIHGKSHSAETYRYTIETGPDYCKSGPCGRGATCVNANGEFKCLCPSGISGVLCDVVADSCHDSPCADGATCVVGIDGFQCVCPSDKIGERCETAVKAVKLSAEMADAIFTDDLTDKTSARYKQLESEIIHQITSLFVNASNFQKLEVIEFKPGSVVVVLNIVLLANSTTNDEETAIQDLKDNLDTNGLLNYTIGRIERQEDHCEGVQCLNSGMCMSGATDYVCYCRDNFIGRNCETEFKEKIRLTDGYKMIHVTEEEDVRNPVFDVSSLMTNPNAAQRYDLLPSAASSTFLLDNLSGKVNATIDKFDYEEKDRYELEIDIVDSEGTTRVLLIIVVDNINDNRPYFTNIPYESTIMEYAPVGSLVAAVTALDADGTNALTYVLPTATSDIASLFSITEDGRILVEGILNRKRLENDGHLENGKLLIPVSVTDGEWTESSTVFLTLEPLFVRDSEKNETGYQVAIPENATVGSFVADVSVSDPEKNEITYKYRISVGRPDEYPFAINETTGVIMTRLPLDREEDPLYRFSIIVLENQCLSGIEILLEIVVEDVNDEIPTFGELSYSASIREDAGSPSDMTPVIIIPPIQATDDDFGLNADIRYSLTGFGMEIFVINPKSGDVWLKANPDLDYESVKKYSLTVVARDRDGNPDGNSNSVPFTVKITDANDNSPVFSQQSWTLRIRENSSLPTVMTTVHATDADEGLNSELRYHMEEGGDGKFRIDSTTGELSLRSELDRETKDEYFLVIIARDQGFPAQETSVYVNVTVLDVNDNSPRFDQQFYSGHTPEGQTGSAILTVIASDPDLGENAEIEYGLTDRSTFAIDSNGTISASAVLDREAVPAYDIVVTATDRGMPQKSSSVQVRIVVDDINDNEPQFSSRRYDAKILLPHDGIKPGTLVLFVSATDLDIGSNAEIRYSVTSEHYTSTFEINQNGAISAKEKYIPISGIDDEVLTFNISAKDGGSPQKEDIAMVVITFETPSEVFEFNETMYFFNVMENEKNVDIGNVEAFSRNVNKDFVYDLPYSIEGVALDQYTGSINVTRPIDRETTSKVTFNVLAHGDDENDKDDGFAFTTVEITIQDVNDEVPYFIYPQEPVLWTELPENSLNDSYVQFQAEDRDQDGPNSQIVYSIADGNNDGVFDIDRSTGLLRVIEKADKESVESYSVIIMASDQGTPSLNTTVSLKVEILDENDNTPNITTGASTVAVNENIGIGTAVTYVRASDDDKGQNAEIYFQLEEDSNSTFYVSEISGSIRTAKLLDRENEDAHTITVVAIDKGSPAKTSTPLLISFKVEDYNDNAPEFVNPNYYVPLPKDSPRNTNVLMVSAVDRDIGINAIVTYDIIGGGNCSQNHFQINSTTGQIITTDNLYDQPSGSCLLPVRCQDMGIDPLSSISMIEINIEEVNFPPKFLSESYRATINENDLIGTDVKTEPQNPPQATDDDKDANGEVYYDIVGGNDEGLFSIDRQSGQITVSKALDREAIASAELIISAHDITPDPKSAIVIVTITIEDANDNAPELPQELNATITQDGSSGALVTTIKARDSDIGKNAECFYHIARARFEGIGPVNPSDYFSINQTNGAITTTDNLYKLNLTSTIDIGLILVVRNVEPLDVGPYTRTNLNPTASWLTVTFRYDYTPRCREDEYLVNVNEDKQPGESLNITIEPRNNGTKPLPSLFYEIIWASAWDVFTINAVTGDILTSKVLDVGTYNLTIAVRTSDPDNGEGSCTVLVDVYRVTTIYHMTTTLEPGKPPNEDYLVALVGVSAVAIVLFIILVTVCLILYWRTRTRGKFNNKHTKETQEQAVSSLDRRGSPSERARPQRPNWLMMRSLPDEPPEKLETFKPDPTQDKSMNKYTKMWKHFRASQYKPGEVAQRESGFYMAVRESGAVNDDYIHPVSTQDAVPQLPPADYDDQPSEIDYDDDNNQQRIPSYLLPESWQ